MRLYQEAFVVGKQLNPTFDDALFQKQFIIPFFQFCIRYHPDTPLWNKHMVKRMLENKRYTGMDGYPIIIQPELFERVAVIRAGKAVIREKAEKQPAPTLSHVPPTVPGRLTDISIARMENQINQELSRPVLEPERLQDMIFQLAIKKYEAIRSNNSIQSNQVDADSVHFDI